MKQRKPYETSSDGRFNSAEAQASLIADLRDAQAGDIEARNRIVVNNMGLVYKVFGIRFGFGAYDDFVGEGAECIMKCTKSFDCDRRTAKFSTYVCRALHRCVSNIERMRRRDRRHLKSLIGGLGEQLLRDHDREDSRPLRLLGSSSVRDALDNLPQRWRDVVYHRALGHTLEFTGDCLGVGRERVRQIQAKAVEELRYLLAVDAA